MSPPRNRSGSRKSSLTKAHLSNRARCWFAGHRHAGGPTRRSQGKRRRHAGKGGGHQGGHRQAQGRNRARQDRGQTQHRSRRGACRLAAGSGCPQNGAARQPAAGLQEEEAKLRTIEARGQSCAGERRDDPNPHRRRDAQVPRSREGAVSPGRSWRGPGSRRKGADAGEPEMTSIWRYSFPRSRLRVLKIGAEAQAYR